MRTTHVGLPRKWDKHSVVCTHYVDGESRTFIPESGALMICIEPIIAPYTDGWLKVNILNDAPGAMMFAHIELCREILWTRQSASVLKFKESPVRARNLDNSIETPIIVGPPISDLKRTTKVIKLK